MPTGSCGVSMGHTDMTLTVPTCVFPDCAWPSSTVECVCTKHQEQAMDMKKPELQSVTYKTQKAKGLQAAWPLSGLTAYGYSVAVMHGVLPYYKEDLNNLFKRPLPIFARPAPIMPRHGFVESRVVKSVDEIKELYEETLRHDPQGELILMDKLTGRFSAVMTATGVTWALGNDGVTSGKGKQYHIPTPSGVFDTTMLNCLGIKDKSHGVYCELVEHRGAVCCVQVRLGPKQPDSRAKRIMACPNLRVRHIVSAENDNLILWDKTMKLHRPHNTLVWLPGHSLSSHFVVQAMANGLSVSIEETCPAKVGEILQADKTELARLSEADYKRLARYLKEQSSFTYFDGARDVMLSVGILHSLPYWSNERHLLKLRAMGAMMAARYSLAACLGESRHLPRDNWAAKENGQEEQPICVPWEKLMGKGFKIGVSTCDRSYVFTRAFVAPWNLAYDLAIAAAADLHIKGQPHAVEYISKPGCKLDDYKTGYRGMKWEWAALKSADLIAAINKFILEPNEANWGPVVGFYNEVVNCAHNGGYLLNKWADTQFIDRAASSPSFVFGFAQVMNVVFCDSERNLAGIWRPKSELDDASDYKLIGGGIYVHKDVVTNLIQNCVLKDNGELFSKCNCLSCLQVVAMDIGIQSAMQNKKAYVEKGMLRRMPYFTGEKPWVPGKKHKSCKGE